MAKDEYLDPEKLLEALWDGDKSLRFDALYDFIRDNNLQKMFFEYTKKDFYETCPPDEVEAEWTRIVTEAGKSSVDEAEQA